MEFGKTDRVAINTIDFSLPQGNSDILNGFFGRRKLYFGLPKWSNPEWVGNLYPPHAKEKDFLTHYVQHFNTIELNATHYSIQREERIDLWKQMTSTLDFKFCPKMFKGVTHAGSVADKGKDLELFLYTIRFFGEKLGPVFIQLSENFSIRRARELEVLLKKLPTDLTFFVEVRHPDWFRNARWFDWLSKMGIGTMITDTAGRRDAVHTNLTIPKAMVRFVATNHPSDKIRLDHWASQVKYWLDNGIDEVYFFMHSEDELQSPSLLQYFVQNIKMG